MGNKKDFQSVREPKKKLSDSEKQWLDSDVYVEFYNVEEPGLTLKFTYGSTKKPVTYTLMHGGKYHLPRRVVQHLQGLGTPIYKWIPDGSGILQKEFQGTKPRFQCRELYESNAESADRKAAV